MIRKVTKMSTVTPKSTMTKSKSLGQGVKNIGKKQKTASQLKSAEAAKIMSSTKPKGGFFKNSYNEPEFESLSKMEKNRIASSVAAGAMASTIMRKAVKTSTEMPQLMRKVVKTGTKVPKSFKAKMLPEVKVTAPGKLKRFVSKITSRRK
jgi:hypothetical protein